LFVLPAFLFQSCRDNCAATPSLHTAVLPIVPLSMMVSVQRLCRSPSLIVTARSVRPGLCKLIFQTDLVHSPPVQRSHSFSHIRIFPFLSLLFCWLSIIWTVFLAAAWNCVLRFCFEFLNFFLGSPLKGGFSLPPLSMIQLCVALPGQVPSLTLTYFLFTFSSVRRLSSAACLPDASLQKHPGGIGAECVHVCRFLT